MKWITCTAGTFENEDWMFSHYRYKFSKVKLDTDLFEVRDGGLMKKGGTGRLEFGGIEILDETPPPDAEKMAEALSKILEFIKSRLQPWEMKVVNQFAADATTPPVTTKQT